MSNAERQESSYLQHFLERFKRWHWALDLALFLLLTAIALPARVAPTQGDLWFDEADYAHAAMQGFSANRWDRSPDPTKPDALVIQRHYHPPLTSYAVGIGSRWGLEEPALRFPFALAGALTVGVTYLCAVILAQGRREIAIGAALLLAITPLHIRTSAHAIPWSLITLNLMALLWTLLKYAETKRKGWIVGTGATLGVLFSLSEMFPPTLVVLACVAPLLLLPEIKEAEQRKPLLKAMGIGTLVALVIVLILWPAGLFGGAWQMLKHYMGVAKIPVEFATLNGKQYDRAPKWAYLFWYWRDYQPYVVLYASGFVGVLGLLAFRKLTREMAVALVYTLAFLAIAHAAHIIGPQYLVHCLPLLTLVAAMLFCGLATLWRPLTLLALLFCAGYMSRWEALSHIEDPLAHAPRSAAAAQFLKTRWKPGTKMMIGTQYPTIMLWYMQKRAQIPVKEREVYPLPSANWKAVFLKRLAKGEFRYLVLANTFSPQVTVAPEIAKMLKGWKLVYKSAEPENATPRLRIYEWRK